MSFPVGASFVVTTWFSEALWAPPIAHFDRYSHLAPFWSTSDAISFQFAFIFNNFGIALPIKLDQQTNCKNMISARSTSNMDMWEHGS